MKATSPPPEATYLVYTVKKPSYKPPTPPQRRILEQMEPGVWYETEHLGQDGKTKDRADSVGALLNAGWLETARLGTREKDGTARPFTTNELFERIFTVEKDAAPYELYRLAQAYTKNEQKRKPT